MTKTLTKMSPALHRSVVAMDAAMAVMNLEEAALGDHCLLIQLHAVILKALERLDR